MKGFILALALATTTGCVSRPIVSTPPAMCSRLIPDDWVIAIPGAALPGTAAADDAKEWTKAFVNQTVQLSIANGRTKDAIGIFTKCEALTNAARPKP